MVFSGKVFFQISSISTIKLMVCEHNCSNKHLLTGGYMCKYIGKRVQFEIKFALF